MRVLLATLLALALPCAATAAGPPPAGPLTPSALSGSTVLPTGGAADTLANLLAPNPLTKWLPRGSTDYGLALQALCAASPADVSVTLPAGSFVFATAPARCGNRNFTLHGAGKAMTTILTNVPGILFDLTLTSSGQTVDLGGFSVKTVASAGTQALLRTTFPQSYNPTTGTYAFSWNTSDVDVHDVAILSTNAGAGAAGAFCKGVILSGAWLAKITRVDMVGPQGQPGPTGCSMVDASETEDIDLDHDEQTYGDSMFFQSGYVEGVHLEHPVVVGTNWLVNQAASGITARGGPLGLLENVIWVNQAEINTYSGGFQLQHTQDLFASGSHFTRWGGGNGLWQGYALTDVSGTLALGDLFEGGANPSTIVGIQVAVGTGAAAHNKWVGPRFTGTQYPIIFGAGVAQNDVLAARMDAGAAVADSGTSDHIDAIGPTGDRQAFGGGDFVDGPDGSRQDGVSVVAGASNIFVRTPGLTGAGPTSSCTGSDAVVPCNFAAKAAGNHVFSDGLGKLLSISPGDSSPQANMITLNAASAGNAASIGVAGDAAANLLVAPPGLLLMLSAHLPICGDIPAGYLCRASAAAGDAVTAN